MPSLTIPRADLIREAMRLLGRAKSPAKTAAARRNAQTRWDKYRANARKPRPRQSSAAASSSKNQRGGTLT